MTRSGTKRLSDPDPGGITAGQTIFAPNTGWQNRLPPTGIKRSCICSVRPFTGKQGSRRRNQAGLLPSEILHFRSLFLPLRVISNTIKDGSKKLQTEQAGRPQTGRRSRRHHPKIRESLHQHIRIRIERFDVCSPRNRELHPRKTEVRRTVHLGHHYGKISGRCFPCARGNTQEERT